MDKYFSKEAVLDEYYKDNAVKLKQLSDIILKKCCKGFLPDDCDDFYSVANEVFANIVNSYTAGRKCSFETYLSSCLHNRFCSELGRRNRQKRGGNRITVSLDEEINGEMSLLETIQSGKEDVYFWEKELNDKTRLLLKGLSKMQRNIIILHSQGYSDNEIMQKLKINEKNYRNALNQIKDIRIKANSVNKKYTNISKTVKSQKEENKMIISSNITSTNQKNAVIPRTLSGYIEEIEAGEIRTDHPTQRAQGNWNNKLKHDLISTVAQNYPIPSIIIAEEVFSDGTYIMWLLDGLQRTTTLIDYMNDGFKCGKNTENPIVKYQVARHYDNGDVITESVEFDIRGKYFSQLPEELQRRFRNYDLSICKFLACTKDEVDFHIRRYNNQKAMTAAQRGITFLGSNYAKAAKKLSAHSFFKDKCGLSAATFRNGTAERRVIESVMLCNFPDDWKKQYNDMCQFLIRNAKISHFDEIESFAERLDEVTDSDETLFADKDIFIILAAFKKFVKLELPDERFVEFLRALNNNLGDKEVDGFTYNDLLDKNSKDKSIVSMKLNIITALMNEFFGVSEEETADERVSLDDDFIRFRDEFCVDIINGCADSENDKNVMAVKSLMAIDEENTESNLQKYADSLSPYSKRYQDLTERACILASSLQDYTVSIPVNSKLFRRDNIPALIKIVNHFFVLENIDDEDIREWFSVYADNYKGEKIVFEDVKENINKFISYRDEDGAALENDKNENSFVEYTGEDIFS